MSEPWSYGRADACVAEPFESVRDQVIAAVTAQALAATAVCGNGAAEGFEECDATAPTRNCDADCTFAFCGDFTANRSADEDCDEGAVSTTSCDADCTWPICGDATLSPLAGEQCEDGNTLEDDGCDRTCRLEACGNGIVQGAEQCDDGNLVSADGCSDACVREDCDLASPGGEVVCLTCPTDRIPDASRAGCVCAAGFVEVEGVCVDVDECVEPAVPTDPPWTPPCGANGCVNVPGTFLCEIDCTEHELNEALARCGAPGVPGTNLTFACSDTTIFIAYDPRGSHGREDAQCDGIVIDGLDRNITFEMSPACHEVTYDPADGRCGGTDPAGPCECPDVDDGTGLLGFRGDGNTLRNVTVRGFFEGVRTYGSFNTIEQVHFDRICDDAFGNNAGSDGVGNIFRDMVVTSGCDKCSQNDGDIAATAAEPLLRAHYNAIFRNIEFGDCNQPLRMAAGGRFLIERSEMYTSGGGFDCVGPRFSAGVDDELVVHLFDSTISDCQRGVRLGGGAEAVLRRNTIEHSARHGVRVAGSVAGARASLSGNRILDNGGTGSASPGFGGVAVVEGGEVDLGGGSLMIDGAPLSSTGGNTICRNLGPDDLPRAVQNDTAQTLSAADNWWCTAAPAVIAPTLFEQPGLIAIDPIRTTAP